MSTATRQPFAPDGIFGLQIGGEELVPSGRFEAIDPSTGQPWAEVAQASSSDVDRAVATAAKAFLSWRRSTPAQRQELLWRLAEAIEADPDRWARLLATENGRPIREATIADVPTCAGILRFFSGLSRDLRGDQVPVERAETLIYSVREPLGVIGALIPWNSPIITAANKVAPALAAGNTVVLKPSEFASPSVVEFARIANEILPPGVLNVVTGYGPEVGAALVSHREVAKITFTGGTATARRIMAAAGEALTPTVMELGGKGAMVVFDDADLEAAVQDALLGIFMANGEVCVAASRLLVQSGIHDAFRERFAEVTEQIVIGDALDPATQFGPLVNREHRERVTGALSRALEEGAVARVGGGVPHLPAPLDAGFFVSPTLLVDERGETSASREEFFGPVTVLERFEDEAEAVARANSTRYGLAAGVWTGNLGRAHRVAAELNAGIVWVNKWFDLAIGMPMGGVGDSGFGRELSAETLHEYSASKVVNVDLSTERPGLWG